MGKIKRKNTLKEISSLNLSDKIKADRIFKTGVRLYEIGEVDLAIQNLHEALSLSRKIGYWFGVSTCLYNLGIAFTMRGSPKRSFNAFRESQKIATDFGFIDLRMQASKKVGDFYLQNGDYKLAEYYFRISSKIAKERQVNSELAKTIDRLGVIYYFQGRYQEASEQHAQALKIAKGENDKDLEAISLNNLANVHQAISNYKYAIEIYEQALQASYSRKERDLFMESEILGNIGSTYHYLGDEESAIEYLEVSLKLAQNIGNGKQESRAIGNLGIVYERLGNFQQALELFKKELDFFESTSYRQEKAQCLGNIGNLYKSIGQYDLALKFHESSLKISKEIGSKLAEVRSLCNIGICHRALKNYKIALHYQEESLKAAKSIDSLRDQGMAYLNLGNIYREISSPQKAYCLYEISIQIFCQINDFWGEFYSLGGLAGICFSRNKLQSSLEYSNRQLELVAELNSPQCKAVVMCNIGGIYLRQNELQKSESYLRKSLEIQESILVQIENEYDQISLFDLQIDFYMLLQQVLVLQNKYEEALVISEKGRAAIIANILASRKESTFKSFLEEDKRSPSEAIDIHLIKDIVKSQNSIFVEYSFVYSKLYVWILTPSGQCFFRQVNLDCTEAGEALRELAYELPRRIDESSWPDNASYYSQRLYEFLIEPLEDILSGIDLSSIVFIPQHELLFVPFAALQNKQNEFLISRYTISISPSIKILDLVQENNSNDHRLKHEIPDNKNSFLIIGNPKMPTAPFSKNARKLASLPFAEQEAKDIAILLGTEALLQENATKANVLGLIEDSQIVHFATHCLTDVADVNEIPGIIALSPSGEDEGFLTPTEVLQLNLKADLVVLSACNTGIGIMRNEGLIGLSRCFLLSGVPSVIASYWEIPDSESTKQIMNGFYKNLLDGKNKAESLCQTMREVMKLYPNNPRMWAGFTLIGKKKNSVQFSKCSD